MNTSLDKLQLSRAIALPIMPQHIPLKSLVDENVISKINVILLSCYCAFEQTIFLKHYVQCFSDICIGGRLIHQESAAISSTPSPPPAGCSIK